MSLTVVGSPALVTTKKVPTGMPLTVVRRFGILLVVMVTVSSLPSNNAGPCGQPVST